MIIDTHAHIFTEEFNEDFDAVLHRAREAGVWHYLMPNIDVESIAAMHHRADQLPDFAHPMMGLHPCSVKDDFEDQLKVIERHLFQPVRKYIAVGEVGLDLYWDKSTLGKQIEALETQVNWAKNLGLPIVLHVRESFEEIFKVIDRLNDEHLRGVFHCFTGTEKQAQHILDYGNFYLGIGGVATFKNGGIDKFIGNIDMDHILIETDSPYLAPAPHRGKRNEPSYARLVAQRLSECYGADIAEIEQKTTANAQQLFAMEFAHKP